MEDEAPRTAEIIVIIRPSFKKFCGADACRAALFNHLLYWIAQKCKGQPADKIKRGELYWYGSVEEEICTGMDHSWSAWKIRKELDALTEGPGALIGKRHNPVKGWDREYHYFIGEEQGQAIRDACKQQGVDLLGLRLDADVLHLLKTVNAIDENSKSIQRKQQMDLRNTADPFTENSRAIPKVSTKISSKDTNKEKKVIHSSIENEKISPQEDLPWETPEYVPRSANSQMGYVKQAMKECVKLFGEGKPVGSYYREVDEILCHSGIPVIEFREVVNTAVYKTEQAKHQGVLGDCQNYMEYFVQRVRKLMKVENSQPQATPIALEVRA